MEKKSIKEIKEKIKKLQLELYTECEIDRNSDKAIQLSQELDKYILMAQQELLKK